MHGRGLLVFAGSMIVFAVAAFLSSVVLDSVGIDADWIASWTMVALGLTSGLTCLGCWHFRTRRDR